MAEQYLKLLWGLEDLVSKQRVCLTEGGMSSDTPLSETPPGFLPLALGVELALYSSHVEPYDPLSLLVIAPIGSGKTELLKAYAGNRGVVLYNDFTAYGLYSLLSQVQAGLIRHVFVSDLVRLTARGRTVWREILMALNALIEEGISNIETFHVHFHSPKPVKAGVIAALTTDEWRSRRRQWIRYGFLSRGVPLSYHPAPEDVLRGEESIYRGEKTFKPVKLDLPEKPLLIKVPEKHREELKRLGRVIAAVNRDETRFRSHRHVLAMAKSSALRDRRQEVSGDDVRLLSALSVLWLSPYTGDEPSFRIMLELPATPPQLVETLSPLYSRPTVYRRLKQLEDLKAIKRVGGKWSVNL